MSTTEREAGASAAPVPTPMDPATELLLEREITALRTTAAARFVLIAVMAPMTWALAFSGIDRLGSMALMTVYVVVLVASLRLVSRRRRLVAAGLSMAALDVVMILALPFIWYAAMGGAEQPVGLTLKSAVTTISLLAITLNALAMRPLYPALVTVGALGVHLALVGISVADHKTTFTMSYLLAYSAADVATGRVITDMTILALVGAFLTLLAASARRMVIEAVRLQKANVQLGRYFSPNLVPRLLDNPELFRVGGERRELSFVFTDLEGFTSMVETGEPAVVMPLINDYLNELVQAAFRHEGTVDKVVGDAVHVIFGAPTEQPDHASRAVACALEMDAVAERFREGAAGTVALGVTRIGVNSGWAMVGNFGGDALFDYTAHGDAINTAARLEGANKHLGTRICVSQDTVSRVPGFVGRPVGTLWLRGRSTGLEVFEPVTEIRAHSTEHQAYIEAFEMLRAGSPAAREHFGRLRDACPHDPLVHLHLRRLEAGETGTRIDLER